VNLFQEAHQYAERAYSLSKNAASKAVYLDSLECLIRSYWRLSEYQQVRPLLEEGLALAKQLGRKDLLADLSLILGALLKRTDNPQEGQRYLTESLAIARETGNRQKEAEALLALINPLMDWDLREARGMAQAARDIYHALGDEVGEGIAMFRAATTLLELDELAERRRLYERAGDIFKKHSIRLMHAQILMYLVTLDMMACSYVTARNFAEEGLRLVREAGSKSYSAYMQLHLSQPLFEVGEREQAEAYARDALAIFRSTQEVAGIAYALSTLGDMLRHDGKLDEARALLQEAIELSRQHELWELLMSALTHMGMTLADSGDVGASRKCWSEAMTTAMKWGLTVEKLRILSGFVYFAIQAGQVAEAVEVATFLLHFPHIDPATIKTLLPLLETARSRLPSDQFHEASERGLMRALDNIVSQIAAES
jgi:tetratricopeptide (TPR) repeat protein